MPRKIVYEVRDCIELGFGQWFGPYVRGISVRWYFRGQNHSFLCHVMQVVMFNCCVLSRCRYFVAVYAFHDVIGIDTQNCGSHSLDFVYLTNRGNNYQGGNYARILG